MDEANWITFTGVERHHYVIPMIDPQTERQLEAIKRWRAHTK